MCPAKGQSALSQNRHTCQTGPNNPGIRIGAGDVQLVTLKPQDQPSTVNRSRSIAIGIALRDRECCTTLVQGRP